MSLPFLDLDPLCINPHLILLGSLSCRYRPFRRSSDGRSCPQAVSVSVPLQEEDQGREFVRCLRPIDPSGQPEKGTLFEMAVRGYPEPLGPSISKGNMVRYSSKKRGKVVGVNV